MNQWLLAFLIWWLGTGVIIVLGVHAEAAKERAKHSGKFRIGME